MGTQWGQKWGQSAAATSGREGESARLAKRFGAGGGTRTLTGGKPHRILSPARLPVSPLRRLDEDFDFTLGLHLLDELFELLFALTLLEETLDLAADLGERRGARGAALVHLDDVKAKRRFDDRTDRAGTRLAR